jgi:CDK inhibitor PHO81
LQSLREWISKIQPSSDARERLTRLFLAAINESPDEVLSLLLDTELVDVHADDDINERNCLHEAAISGRMFILEAGLERGVDLSRPDIYGRIPLHYACIHGRVDMVRRLLDANISSIDYLDHDNFTPLIHSIIKNHLPCVEQLLARQARIDPASEADHIPLNLACQHSSLPIIQTLLEKNAKFLPDAEGLFPQHLVARSCPFPEVISLLRSHGADLDQRDKLYQWTPLFHAVSEGRVDCLRTLLDHGVNVTVLDEKGLPAMYYAVWEGHLECMSLLWSRGTSSAPHHSIPGGPKSRGSDSMSSSPLNPETSGSGAPEADGIPDLVLPPPIIPLRRYGHNFLDTKTFVQIYFDPASPEPIVFYQSGRYAAARLTVSSKLSDIIPRTVMLPFQEDSRLISFQVDKLDTFAVEFEIFPTFGSKPIAKTVALPDIFLAQGRASGSCCLPLFDPRLRVVGELRFDFQVIKPYHGDPLEITHFATYWKATSALDPERNGQVTGSSLSGDYVQVFVQLTRDMVPILYPSFVVHHHGIEVPVSHLTFEQIQAAGLPRLFADDRSEAALLGTLDAMSLDDLAQVHRLLATSLLPLKAVLSRLPTNVNLDLCIPYPSSTDQVHFGVGPLANINNFADAILTDVFNHARASKEKSPDFMRSIVFTSYNPNICVALNWKQPNCMQIPLLSSLGLNFGRPPY